jgi:hypothetical protein
MSKTDDLIRQHGGLGISGAAGKSSYRIARHVVSRRTGKTLCGLPALTLFGIDLVSKRQVSCMRCYRLAFQGVNAVAPRTPDQPL